MRTGWALEPTRLGDRVDERNNILVEAAVSNYLKMNFDEAYYPMLQNLIAEINMPREIVNPELEIGPYDAALDVAASTHGRDGEESSDDDWDQLSDEDVVERDNIEEDADEDSALGHLD